MIAFLRGLLLLTLLLGAAPRLHAACENKEDVPVRFYYFHPAVFTIEMGLAKPGHEKNAAAWIDAFRTSAANNVTKFNGLVGGQFRLCLESAEPLHFADLMEMTWLKIDKTYWKDVSERRKAGTLTDAELKRAKEAGGAICARLALSMRTLSAFLNDRESSSDPPHPQLPLRLVRQGNEPIGTIRPEIPITVIVFQSETDSYGCGSVLGLGVKEVLRFAKPTSILDPLEKLATAGGGYEGWTVMGPAVPSRKREPEFMQPLRYAIHVRGLSALDKVLLHELGHYLGLSHLHDGIADSISSTASTAILNIVNCRDYDQPQSGVQDTPPMVATLDDLPEFGKYQDLEPAKFPEACKPVTDDLGQEHKLMPLHNLMNQGSVTHPSPVFSRMQIAAMKRMIALMRQIN